MDQAFYKYQLVLLTVICIVLVAYERYLKSKKSPPDHFKDKVEESAEDGHSVLQTNGAAVLTSNVTRAGALQTLMRKYLLVYAIVMGQSTWAMYNLFCVLNPTPIGADWLQGPYVYSLYREQYEFPERLVAVLFVTGFISAAIFAPLVGVWADT
jgi:hypothetical protein